MLTKSLCTSRYRIFKPIEAIITKDQGKKKKNRGDEPIWATIHIYMELTQEKSLCNYFKQAKM
jgi:hypothetical protein